MAQGMAWHKMTGGKGQGNYFLLLTLGNENSAEADSERCQWALCPSGMI